LIVDVKQALAENARKFIEFVKENGKAADNRTERPHKREM